MLLLQLLGKLILVGKYLLSRNKNQFSLKSNSDANMLYIIHECPWLMAIYHRQNDSNYPQAASRQLLIPTLAIDISAA